MLFAHRLAAGLALVFLTSCGGASPVPVVRDSRDGSPGAPDTADTVQADSPAVPDLPDLFELTGLEQRAPDWHEETTPGCQPGDGCFLDPCTANDQCLSGWCVDHLGEGVCTVTCQEECPAGWSCKQVGDTGPDILFVCVSGYPTLCRPCAAATDCVGPGGTQDACVLYPEQGSFCAGACDEENACPDGFACVQAETTNGSLSTQCVNTTGTCPCADKSVALGLATPCAVENDSGICTGERICTQEGLTACDAATPAPETCNGIDDDCDGQTDEPAVVDGVPISLCDDANECTKDICDGAAGCFNEPLTGTECKDGDLCTAADHCEDGICTGKLLACDDDNACTDDACGGAGDCIYTPNQAKCDDSDPCTVADQCSDGQCAGTPVNCQCQSDADCAELEDGDLCNGTLFCNKETFPYQCDVVPDSVVTCPEPGGEDAFCLQAWCDPSTGQCSVIPAHEGNACTDGDACTVGESCMAGECTGWVAANCADDNPCTDDACASESGCYHTPNQNPCNDGNACTDSDVCLAGDCLPGPPLDCDDGNPCTLDVCEPGKGCTHPPADDAECSDSNPCTTGDHCLAGMCLSTGLLDCDDGLVCTTDTCTALDGCVHTNNALPCNDGDTCTTDDHCAEGACVGGGQLVCNDANLCTDDACDPDKGCVFTPNQAPCDDANACTTGDFCQQGQCKPASVLSCSDDNPCTQDACIPASGCAHTLVPDETPCAADGLCAGQCLQGACVETAVEVCDGEDNDCDGIVDPENTDGCQLYWVDTDGDGYGVEGESRCLCAPEDEWSALAPGDCNDADPAVHPDMPEDCATPADDDCDGIANLDCTYPNCKSLLAAYPDAQSGQYDLDTDGDGPKQPFAVSCDMETDGGGWTLVGVASNTGGRNWTSVNTFTSTSTFGTLDSLTANYKSPAWAAVGGTDFLVATEEYKVGYHDLLADQPLGGFVNLNWPDSCASQWLHGPPEYSENLTADQASLFSFTLRGWDDNANCFPNENENSAISLMAADCCWVNGIGNSTCCQPQWSSHDHSLLRKEHLVPLACTPGQWPCNAAGVYLDPGHECYDASCKAPWVRMYVR